MGSFMFDLDLSMPPPRTEPPKDVVAETQRHEREVQAAYDKGYTDALSTQEQQQAALLSQAAQDMCTSLTIALAQRSADLDTLKAQNVTLALTIAKILNQQISHITSDYALAELITQLLPDLQNANTVTVTLNPRLLPLTEAAFKSALSRTKFSGNITFVCAPELGISDVKVVWDNGSIIRDTTATETEIEHHIQSYIASLNIEDTSKNTPVHTVLTE